MSKQEACEKLRKDGVVNYREDASHPLWRAQKAVVMENIARHGAQGVYDMLADVAWPENFGQSPFDHTFMVARYAVRGERPGPHLSGPEIDVANECLDELGIPAAGAAPGMRM